MKSKLTTQEMQDLKKNGVSLKKISEIAGVGPSTICQRLNPKHYRERQKQWRDNHPDYQKQLRLNNPTYFTDWQKNHPEYCAQQRQARKKRNDRTMPGATNRRQEWTLRDLKYLEENAGKLSIDELAAKLGRTFAGVKHVASAGKISLRRQKRK